MLKLATDENVDGRVLRGLLARTPAIIQAIRDLVDAHEPEELRDRILYLKL